MTCALPRHPRRLIIFSVFDKDGQIDGFVVHSLTTLRVHASRILVVVNGVLAPAGRHALEAVADEVLVRENRGFDIGAQRAALHHLGDSIQDFDEIVLTNDTWYGPVRPWAPVLERMDGTICDFWGLTDHRATRPNPVTGRGVAPYHLQSYWIAVRRAMFESEVWRRYWDRLGPLDTYIDAVTRHELRFTAHFAAAGNVAAVAFPFEEFDSENPSLFEAEALVEAGCPVLKRRPLFHWPPLLDAYGAVGAWTLAAAADGGYPTDLILANLARTVPPNVVNADLALLSVLPSDDTESSDPPQEDALRILVIVHSDGSSIEQALRYARSIPGGSDLVITASETDAPRLLAEATASRRGIRGDTSVRVVPLESGAAEALLIGCRDLLLAGSHDLLVRLVSFVGNGSPAHRRTVDDQFDNLLHDEAHVADVIALFEREPTLGIVYSPMAHLGLKNLGQSWGSFRRGFEAVAERLGITVPLDDVAPMAPPEGFYIARFAALRRLFEHRWTSAELRDRPERAWALERMPSYAAGQLGYHTRTVASRDYVSVSLPLLEFELGELSATLPGRSFEKIDFVRHSGPVGTASARDLLTMHLQRRHPRVMRFVRRVVRIPARLLLRRGRSAP